MFFISDKPGRHNLIHRSRGRTSRDKQITWPFFNIFVQYLYNICALIHALHIRSKEIIFNLIVSVKKNCLVSRVSGWRNSLTKENKSVFLNFIVKINNSQD